MRAHSKAIKRAGEILDRAAEVRTCLRARVCPTCAEDVEVVSIGGDKAYLCTACDFRKDIIMDNDLRKE